MADFFQVKAQQDQNIVDCLQNATGLAKTALKDAMLKGAVWLEKPDQRPVRVRRASKRLSKGETLKLHYDLSILSTTPPLPELVDLGQDFSVWNKPAGLMSGGSRYGDHCAINRVVERELDRPTFLVHRLDRFVWGIMVLAHTKRAAAALSAQFQNRETKKIYWAVIEGNLYQPLTLDDPIDSKEAISYINPIDTGPGRSLVEVKIETGRKHQIRRHLSEAGYPIVGDKQYGKPDEKDIQLASVSLSLQNLEGLRVNYELEDHLRPSL